MMGDYNISNDNTTHSDEHQVSPWTDDVMTSLAILSATSFLGIIGNTHVIIVYVMYYKKSNFRLYVLLLAIVDLIASLLLIPSEIIYIFRFDVVLPMSLFGFISPSMLMISLSLIVLIGVDRARRVIKPLGTQLTYAEAKFTCAMIFVVVFVIVILFYVHYILFYENSTNKLLFMLTTVTGLEYECLNFCLVVICFVVYTVMVIQMCRKLIKFGKLHVICKCTSNKNHHLQVITEIDRIRARNYTKGARKVFVFLVMAFVSSLCITPRIVLMITLQVHILKRPTNTLDPTIQGNLFNDDDYLVKQVKIGNLLQCVQYLNHCINPIVYGLFDLQFRKRCVI